MANREIPVEDGCPECGKGEVRQLIGNIMMADPASVSASGRRPDNSYGEVISKINETNDLTGTRYEVKDRHQDRGPDIKKRRTEYKYDMKKEAHDKLRAKKGRGK
jgi:hypothetical protein